LKILLGAQYDGGNSNPNLLMSVLCLNLWAKTHGLQGMAQTPFVVSEALCGLGSVFLSILTYCLATYLSLHPTLQLTYPCTLYSTPFGLHVLECSVLSHFCFFVHTVSFAWNSLFAYLTWPISIHPFGVSCMLLPFRKPSLTHLSCHIPPMPHPWSGLCTLPLCLSNNQDLPLIRLLQQCIVIASFCLSFPDC
jgi:hypothetical protein